MKVIAFKVNLSSAFTHNQLIKSGWQVEEENKLYSRVKGNFKYSYIIKAFGKIRVSEIFAEIFTDEKKSYSEMIEFSLEEGWKNLWNKSFVPESVEVLMKNNIFNQLIENDWKPSVMGVIDYVKEENNLSFYYPAPEGENIYKLVDDNPEDVLKFIYKLRALNIF